MATQLYYIIYAPYYIQIRAYFVILISPYLKGILRTVNFDRNKQKKKFKLKHIKTYCVYGNKMFLLLSREYNIASLDNIIYGNKLRKETNDIGIIERQNYIGRRNNFV